MSLSFSKLPILQNLWGGPPGPRGTPSSRYPPNDIRHLQRKQADEGVGRGPGGPPHNQCRLVGYGKTKWHWPRSHPNTSRWSADLLYEYEISWNDSLWTAGCCNGRVCRGLARVARRRPAGYLA